MQELPVSSDVAQSPTSMDLGTEVELILGSTGGVTAVLVIAGLSCSSMCCCISLIDFWQCKSNLFVLGFCALLPCYTNAFKEVSTDFSVQSARIECCRKNSGTKLDMILCP